MESLRWILLIAGIIFVIVLYVLGRSRRRQSYSMVDDMSDTQDVDLPAFSAQSLDDVDEGVGQVRVVTRSHDDVDVSALNVTAKGEPQSESSAINIEQDAQHNIQIEGQNKNTQNIKTSDDVSDKTVDEAAGKKAPNDIIVLYILPKGDNTLAGSHINSSAQAMGLSFGEMNVFHYMDNSRSVFSLANMLEPGSFDADTIHDLKTTGLTVFMQLQAGDPLDDLTEMLQRSYQLAGLLDARLCNHNRQPLTEQDAESYRTQVSDFVDVETAELSSET